MVIFHFFYIMYVYIQVHVCAHVLASVHCVNSYMYAHVDFYNCSMLFWG